MIDQDLITHLHQRGDVRYTRYAAPMAGMYLLGDDRSLQAILFEDSWPADSGISSWFKKGRTGSIASAVKFLDAYFHPSGSREARAVRAAATAGGTCIIRVTMNGITLAMDLSRFTLKEISVYRALLAVPSGAVIPYGELARRAGIPGGARFAGNAMAKNAFPVIIPCHRVIKSDGSMGNYSGGIHIKRYLLEFEKISGL